MKEVLVAIGIMAGTTYLIRVLPLTLFTKKITNRFVRSFLAYVPVVVLAAMTFPAIFVCTNSTISATLGCGMACLAGYYKRSLVEVAALAVLVVFLVERVI